MSESKSKKILATVVETLDSSSIHALPNIVKNQSYLIKFMWVICFLASNGVCFWFLTTSVMAFLEYDVVSNIHVNFVDKLAFPIVSVCSLKRITGLKSINELILNCTFGLMPCNMTEDFESFQDTQFGTCFRFNSGKYTKYVYKRGFSSGLVLALYAGLAEENSESFDHGFSILISNESLSPNSNEGIKISTGLSTYINLNKYTINLKAQPYSNCFDNLISADSYSSDIYKKTLESNKKYSTYHFKNCYYVCVQKFIIDNCNCQFSGFDFLYNSVGYCSSNSCFLKYEKIFSTSSEYLKQCDCPLECQNTGYNFIISNADFPTNSTANQLFETNDIIKTKLPNRNYQTLRRSVSKVIIFFDEMKETIIDHDAKIQLADLVSSVGGTLGLFLGKLYSIFLT
jgi:hypothetical protein